MAIRILLVHGPNLNWLGRREPEIYGTSTLDDIEAQLGAVARRWADVELECYQSNSEGALIDYLQARAADASGVVINPGGLAHTSIVLRDAVAALPVPVVEVHLTNIHTREPFRRRSLLAGACRGIISGLGTFGYEAALEYLARTLGARGRS
jgi:3-dehydroquinate dehydratase-2